MADPEPLCHATEAEPLGPLSVRVTGEGTPTVLWHSLFVDDRSWDRLTPLLAGTRQVITVTGPGHGQGHCASGDPDRGYSNGECAAAAATVLTELGVRDPVDWVGNTWGRLLASRRNRSADRPQPGARSPVWFPALASVALSDPDTPTNGEARWLPPSGLAASP